MTVTTLDSLWSPCNEESMNKYSTDSNSTPIAIHGEIASAQSLTSLPPETAPGDNTPDLAQVSPGIPCDTCKANDWQVDQNSPGRWICAACGATVRVL